MPLYTFIVEYLGGTYISQVRASTPRSASRAWAKQLDESAVWGIGMSGKEKLIEEMKSGFSDPVAITGVKHTWCCSALVRNKLMSINFVQTAE
jgi:hypothetical protein